MIDRRNYTVLTHCMQIISCLHGLIVAICCEVKKVFTNPSFVIRSVAFGPPAALLLCFFLHYHLHLIVGSLPTCFAHREVSQNTQYRSAVTKLFVAWVRLVVLPLGFTIAARSNHNLLTVKSILSL